MRTRRLLGFVALAAALATAAPLPYQGILTDAKGIPVADGQTPIAFAVFKGSVGGAPLWSEARTVQTRKGLFSVGLGEVNPLPDSLFAQDSLFLDVMVNGTSLTPRSRLGASPWAFRAVVADSAKVAGTVAGLARKVDTAALTTRLAGYAKSTDLAAYATTSSLTSYAKSTDLAAYAPSSALANYATTSSLASYAKSTDLANYARTIELANYVTQTAHQIGLGAKVDTGALTTRIAGYAKSTDLAGYATTTALSSYAKSTDLASYALVSSLAVYAKTSALSNYATTAAVSAKADRSEVLLKRSNGSVEISGNYPSYKVGLTELQSGQLTLHTDTSETQYGFPAWYVNATAEEGFQVQRYVGGPSSSYSYLTILPGTGTTLRGAVRTTDSLVVAKNLRVGGKIFASTATITVPDYVFEPGYRLAPLQEVEAYVEANKHLPEVPAAAELEKAGIDVAQMNLLLLKKIEELTLHAIAQEKRIQALERRVP